MSTGTPHLLAFAALVLLSACSTDSGTETLADSRAWWSGDGVVGSPRIVIDLSQQRLRYFKGGQLVGVSPISSGREGNSTLNGKFRIIEKDLDHRSSLYGSYVDASDNIVVGDVDARVDPCPPGAKFVGAGMRYFMRIVGGIGMHEGYLPGFPASHGCIRLPTRMAAIFYENTPHGTPVEVIGHGSLAASEDAIPLGHDALEVAIASPEEPPPQVEERVPEPEKPKEVKEPKPRRAWFAGTRPTPVEEPPSRVAISAPPQPTPQPEPKPRATLVSTRPVEKSKPRSAPRPAAVAKPKAGSSFTFFRKRPPPGTTLYLED
ncbi:MAG: L,D-transpeptidase family protein [Prosthecobacter sp.]